MSVSLPTPASSAVPCCWSPAFSASPWRCARRDRRGAADRHDRAQLGLSSIAAGMLITCPCCLRRRLAGRRRPGAPLRSGAHAVRRAAADRRRHRRPFARIRGRALRRHRRHRRGHRAGQRAAAQPGQARFSAARGRLTSAYVLTMSVIAGAASAVAIPLAAVRRDMALFGAVPAGGAGAGALLWLPQLSRRTGPRPSRRTRTASGCGQRAGLAGDAVPGHQFLRVLCDGELAAGDPAGCRLHGGAGRLAAWPAAADVGGPALFLAPAVRR